MLDQTLFSISLLLILWMAVLFIWLGPRGHTSEPPRLVAYMIGVGSIGLAFTAVQLLRPPAAAALITITLPQLHPVFDFWILTAVAAIPSSVGRLLHLREDNSQQARLEEINRRHA